MAEKDLELLLRGMDPVLSGGKYWMGTFDESQMMALANYLECILCIFREGEGLSVIFDEAALEDLGALSEKKTEGPFALITLNVNSDLLAVGFLAEVSAALAGRSIPCNAQSAYFHDHILVPFGLRDEAMEVLRRLQAGH